ncbi:hypothetical protein HanIR_Chr10g0461081 [Helianthus annuus]|nr:hypothetical protein HanIR_Chr10g0461081 [Helianthus annuus]
MVGALYKLTTTHGLRTVMFDFWNIQRTIIELSRVRVTLSSCLKFNDLRLKLNELENKPTAQLQNESVKLSSFQIKFF